MADTRLQTAHSLSPPLLLALGPFLLLFFRVSLSPNFPSYVTPIGSSACFPSGKTGQSLNTDTDVIPTFCEVFLCPCCGILDVCMPVTGGT